MTDSRVRSLTRDDRWRWVAFCALILGFGLVIFVLSHQQWVMSDGRTYQDAGARLREGGRLYVPSEVGERSYRYAPWFAFLWMAIPIPDAVWISAMTACSALAVIPSFRSGWFGVAVGALVFPYLLVSAMGGHVQPAVVAMLVYGVNTRWGPAVIGMVASLKFAPILYILVYVARRQWWAAAIAAAVTIALIAPMLLYDLSGFPLATEGSWGLFEWSPLLWLIVCLGLGSLVLLRPSWFAASVLVMLAIPKFVYYDVSYLLVGIDELGETGRDALAVQAHRD